MKTDVPVEPMMCDESWDRRDADVVTGEGAVEGEGEVEVEVEVEVAAFVFVLEVLEEGALGKAACGEAP